MATKLTIAQIESVISAGYPNDYRSSIDNVWQAFNSKFNYSTLTFDNFLSFIMSYKKCTTDSPTGSSVSLFGRAVYLEVSNLTQRSLDCDAIFDCMKNRIADLNQSSSIAFASLDGLNPKRPAYWHSIMKNPFADCSPVPNACEALVKAYNNAMRIYMGTYIKLTSLPSGYHYFNETYAPDRVKIGDLYFRKN
ncbi:MAG: hypothetical protein LBU32_07270 [Clostridiales bacterium]|nr:hypothetical protein [Clostridiales bacterium]